MTTTNLRAFIADLQTLTELIETEAGLPEMEVRNNGSEFTISFNFWDHSAAAQIAATLPLFPGIKFTKNNPANGIFDEKYYIMSGTMRHGTIVELCAHRSTVCNRVVTATETVTEELPDPAEVAKLPTIKHERTVETVEWQCVPLLAKAESFAS